VGVEPPHLGTVRPAARILWESIARHGCAGLGRIVILDQSPKLATDATWQLGIYGDWRPVLGRIDRPALLIYGGESNYYHASTGQYVRDSIAGSRLVVYEGADHAPHVCNPERFCADVVAFAAER
jgi:non-heme chloroperoxidase